MLKRVYFIISYLLQLLLSITSLIMAKDITNKILSDYKELKLKSPSDIWDGIIAFYSKYGEIVVCLMAILVIIVSVIILINLFKNKENYNRKLILWTSVIIMIITEDILISMLSLINVIVCLFIFKKNKVTKEIKKENDLPKELIIKNNNFNKKDISLAIVAILSFIIAPEFIRLLPISILGLQITLDITLFIIYFFIFRKEVIIAFKKLFKNLKKYVSYVFNKQVAMFGIYLLVGIIVSYIKGGDATSVNQQVAESLPYFYIVPASIIYAPFVEELLFRGAIRRLIKNDILFIVISGFTFGLLHTLAEATLFDIIILSLPYGILGGFFAYLYVKTGNIATSMLGHFFHNSLACFLMIMGN